MRRKHICQQLLMYSICSQQEPSLACYDMFMALGNPWILKLVQEGNRTPIASLLNPAHDASEVEQCPDALTFPPL